MTTIDNLSAFYITMYNNQSASLEFLIDCATPKEVFLSIYQKFINENILMPIEKLPDEEKKELVAECRATGLEFTNSTLINSAKILHTIKFINANS